MPVVDDILDTLIRYLQKTKQAHQSWQKNKKKKIVKKTQKKVKKAAKKQSSKSKKTSPSTQKKISKKQPTKKKATEVKGFSKSKSKKASPKKTLKQKKKSASKTKSLPKKTKAKKSVKTVKEVNTPNAKNYIGRVTHYFSRIGVTVLKIEAGKLSVGDEIHISGKSTNFKQKIRSLQIESVDVSSAKKGKLVGLKVNKKVSVSDKVHKIR